MAKRRPTPEETKKQYDFYLVKVQEYDNMTLEELRVFYQENEKKIGGMNKRALFDVTNTKLQKLKEETIEQELKRQSENEQKEVVQASEENSSVDNQST